MTDQQQIKNIIAFLAILFGEEHCWYDVIMKFNPDYILEKFNRYVMSTHHESDWGLHLSLRRSVFEPYCQKWKIPFTQYEEIS